ncbi:ParB family chromosome partitioning protein [Ignavibacterium album JCM 16511]|uniref:ParB family chromosome partitioning protein n=1 Tax=Ignavibacterium album (strain DSM 19864 / JCM 16511 / NBRC 101810 / Mat9-16) TaxID=945713 RepID=I0AJY9_IGNAJ|nr:ParB/RepB/Spo0J family partition protein [Ignavibacterium album]AFH49296.1 ParB family chromosome partitioning protein [Ignavibacterium album JCM 16511]
MKSSLGRGLDALINPNLIEDKSGEKVTDLSNIKLDDGKQVDILAKIAVDLISPNPFQPRTNFDTAALEELKKSILINGLIQPITVRRIQGKRYQLISGERRLRAFKDIGYKEIPAYIIKVESDEILLALALIENIQREHLNPIEVAKAYKRLMEECHLTQEEIAEKVGKDRTTIANTIRLLKLPERIQNALIKEEISMGHARALISLPNEQIQLFAFEKILKDGLSVRKVEKLAKSIGKKPSDSKKSDVISVGVNSYSNIHTHDLEDRLRRIFGTKVVCSQRKDGTGEIKIEFYSNDELERLLELFEIINKTYS